MSTVPQATTTHGAVCVSTEPQATTIHGAVCVCVHSAPVTDQKKTPATENTGGGGAELDSGASGNQGGPNASEERVVCQQHTWRRVLARRKKMSTERPGGIPLEKLFHLGGEI